MDIILNQVAIWRASGTTKLNKRLAPSGTSYRMAGSGVYQRSSNPIIRYCKDYEVGKGKNKVSFCLFVRTDFDNDVLVEEQLDAIAKEITVEQALKVTANATVEAFEYLPKVLREEI